MDQWLIRTSDNVITGPVPKEELNRRIQRGDLGPHDEVCEADGYWFYLHEREEVLQQLGIELPKQAQEDVTLTQTETDIERTDPELRYYGRPSQAPPEGDLSLPELAEAPGGSETTAILTNRALRQYQPRRPAEKAAPTPSIYPPQILGKLERPSFLRVAVVVLALLACILILAVLYVLETR
jgi:hypothetical protein